MTNSAESLGQAGNDPGGADNWTKDLVIDTRLADTVEWIAKVAGDFASQRTPALQELDPDVQDLRYCIGKAASTGEISPEHVVGALADTLQAICLFGDDGFAEFMNSWVAMTFASAIRLDSPLLEVITDTSEYPHFDTEPVGADISLVDLEVTFSAARRLGALIHNLRREPVGVNTCESSDEATELAEEWTIGAALNAYTHGGEGNEVTGQEAALLISLPILLITALFDWLDERVLDGLSSAALKFLKSEMLPSIFQHLSDEQKEAA